jgi:hypothetical protein
MMEYIELSNADFIGLAFWIISMPLLAWANRVEKRREAREAREEKQDPYWGKQLGI